MPAQPVPGSLGDLSPVLLGRLPGSRRGAGTQDFNSLTLRFIRLDSRFRGNDASIVHPGTEYCLTSPSVVSLTTRSYARPSIGDNG